jgi:hypothetical protein
MAEIPFTAEQLQEAIHEFEPPSYTGFLEADWSSVRHVEGTKYHVVAKVMQGGFTGNVDKGQRVNLSIDFDGSFQIARE